MSGYSVSHLEDVPDMFGESHPGEMRLFAEPLGTGQIAFTYRRMPHHTGGKGSYGHLHGTQEEIYCVISGRLQIKLDDDVVDVGVGAAVRVAPEVVRSVWNDEAADTEIIICSVRLEDHTGEVASVPDFWRED